MMNDTPASRGKSLGAILGELSGWRFARPIHNRGIHYATFSKGATRPDSGRAYLNDGLKTPHSCAGQNGEEE